MLDLPKNKKVILFDGVCNLCNDAVLEIIKHDKNNAFVFASLQSKVGKQILNQIKVDTAKTDSIIFYNPNVCYDVKSSAILKIANQFSGLWKLTQFFWIFPRPFRDFFYDFIAKNRYKWFGKKHACMIPTPELKVKFLK